MDCRLSDCVLGPSEMKRVLVGFCTDKRDRISTLIRWATWWRHSHVVLVSTDSRYIIEATHGKGVVLSTLKEFLTRDSAEIRGIPHHNPEECWRRALMQVGKPYDWKYTWSWVFRRRDWQDDNAWACSELVAWAGEWFADQAAGSITARELWLISEPLTD